MGFYLTCVSCTSCVTYVHKLQNGGGICIAQTLFKIFLSIFFNFSVNIEMFQKPVNDLASHFYGSHILTVTFPTAWTNKRCFLRDAGRIFTNFLYRSLLEILCMEVRWDKRPLPLKPETSKRLFWLKYLWYQRMPNASVAHFDFTELHFYNGTKRMKEAHLKYLYFKEKKSICI